MRAGEEWRPVEGWPYEVSSLGRVRRTGSAHRLLKPSITRSHPRSAGYLSVNLCRGGAPRSFRVATLVCRAFHGPRPSKAHQAAHENGENFDNRADNLYWATPQENAYDVERHGHRPRGAGLPQTKLTEDNVREIHRRIAAGEVQSALAREFGVSRATITEIKKGRRWKHVS